MQYYNFNGLKSSYRYYGGHSCQKDGVLIDDEAYLVKYPDKLKDRNLNNVELSYSNSSICEYMGSKIYRMTGFQVHEVFLGERKGKTVALCKDFEANGSRLFSFHAIAMTGLYTEDNPLTSMSSGTGNNLEIIFQRFKESNIIGVVPELEPHFWDMFVMDAFIGNSDRNNENWGVLSTADADNKISFQLAPVYDNGSCLNCRFSENRMERALNNPQDFLNVVNKGCVCFHNLNGHRLNPFRYMESGENENCTAAIKRVVPAIDLEMINLMISDLEQHQLISSIQARYYKAVLTERYENILIPVYEQFFGKLPEKETFHKQAVDGRVKKVEDRILPVPMMNQSTNK